MMETLRSLLLAGLGALDLTQEKLHAIFDELVHRGEVTQEQAAQLLATWKARAAERRDAFASEVRAVAREEVKAERIPTRQEFDSLAEHVARLERQVTPVEEVPAR